MANNPGITLPNGVSASFFQKLSSGVQGVLFTYWLSADGRYHRYPFVSYRVRELFGVEPGQLMENADPVFHRIHPQDLAGVEASIQQSLKSLQPWCYRARVKVKNDTYQWFEAHSVPERQQDGSTLWYGEFHNIQQYKELERSLRESEAEFAFQAGFQKLIARLSADFIHLGFGSIDECIDRLLSSIGVFFNIDRAYLYAFSDDNLVMSNTHEWCAPGAPSLIQDQQDVAIGDFQWWQKQLDSMREQNRVLFIEDVRSLPPEASGECALLEAQGVSSMFCVPIHVRGQLAGFFGVDSLSPRTWRKDMGDLLIIVSSLLSGALERNRLEEDLLNQSIRDPLTGLHNRRYLMPRLEEILASCRRTGERFCLVMFDIDHFKRINDSQGHLAGDQVLIRFTEVLLRYTRTTDVVSRFGGEEFLVVFACTSKTDVHTFVMRIMEAVRLEEFNREQQTFRITVSAGAVCVSEFTNKFPTPETLIARADERLYQAKGSGRDCLVDASGVVRRPDDLDGLLSPA